jgi:hypothetical protein
LKVAIRLQRKLPHSQAAKYCPAKRAWRATHQTRFHSGRRFRVTTTGRAVTADSAADLAEDEIAAGAAVEAAAAAVADDSGAAVPAAVDEGRAEIESGGRVAGTCLRRNMLRRTLRNLRILRILRSRSAAARAGAVNRPRRHRKY